jgi:hypothetical protein
LSRSRRAFGKAFAANVPGEGIKLCLIVIASCGGSIIKLRLDY